MTLQQQIKSACDISGITLTELAQRMGMSQQSLSNRLKTGKFSKDELNKIAECLGATLVFRFTFPDGTTI